MAQAIENFNIGLVFGKFYPLTRGHQYLIETARSRCQKLYVAVGSRPSETIPPEVRAGWIRELYPDVCVVVQPNTLPYFPHECATEAEFYTIWARALRDVCDSRAPDVLFTSEDYGDITAHYLGCRHVMVDRQRAAVPICATKVRENPFAQWDYLDPVVRSYFVKTICLYGPESTGKSTLCAQLASHFKTVWQPEWARDYLGDRHCEYADMEMIARGHFGEHEKYRRQANRLLFMDTDAITTLVYSQHYYRQVPAYVSSMADQMNRYVGLYLVTDIDIPWVADTSRDLGQTWQRDMMKQRMLDQLNNRCLPYVEIKGSGEARLQNAIAAVNKYLQQHSISIR